MSEPALTSARDDAARLKRRVEYFLSSPLLGRAEVSAFARAAALRGDVYIVGGMLRDLFLAGNRSFSSDIDFIISECSSSDFDALMLPLGARRNRFGGYRIQLQKWSVEMWRLEDTWAHREGLCDVFTVEDVGKTTFFDWDPIFYNVARRDVLVEPDYFQRLRNRILEVRLGKSPNPLANIVRALRYANKWDALFGPGLARLVLQTIVDTGWERLRSYEMASFHDPQLPLLDGDDVEHRLRRYERTGDLSWLRIGRRAVQPSLPLSDGSDPRQLSLML